MKENTNKGIIALIIIIIIATGAYMLCAAPKKGANSTSTTSGKQSAFDPKNASYEIEGKKVTLVNGKSETEAAPGSTSKITTLYFGNEAYGDLNGDGVLDVAFLLTQNTGGSGTFYYAVVALTGKGEYKVTNAFLIGDRIAPQSTEIQSGELHVNYAERKPDEPMSATPSIGAVTLLKVTPDGILEGLMK